MKNSRVSSIGVIISTYNKPSQLEKALCGYLCQTRPADEIIIADDGSKDETRLLIDSYRNRLPIRHVWHEDKGWRKCRILNSAIEVAKSEYLIFSDQDCIPRKDFVQTHINYAQYNHFLSGGYFKLPKDISEIIKKEDIINGNAFDLEWLKSKGMKWNFKCTKLTQNKRFADFMNFITTARPTWNGMNSSTWKELLLKVNGFNNSMLYGGMDRELGERLVNLGVKPSQIRYHAITLHLYHDRPYKSAETFAFNNKIREKDRKEKIVETPDGIRETEK